MPVMLPSTSARDVTPTGYERHVAHTEHRKDYTGSWSEDPEEDSPLGKPRQRCEDNIKMDLQDVGRVEMDWIDVVQDTDRL